MRRDSVEFVADLSDLPVRSHDDEGQGVKAISPDAARPGGDGRSCCDFGGWDQGGVCGS